MTIAVSCGPGRRAAGVGVALTLLCISNCSMFAIATAMPALGQCRNTGAARTGDEFPLWRRLPHGQVHGRGVGLLIISTHGRRPFLFRTPRLSSGQSSLRQICGELRDDGDDGHKCRIAGTALECVNHGYEV